MTDSADSKVEALHARVNGETGRMTWGELTPHFAKGRVIHVTAGLDLVEVAMAMTRDDTATIQPLLDDNRVRRASDDDARAWNDTQAEFWAVVVAPWLLVQPVA